MRFFRYLFIALLLCSAGFAGEGEVSRRVLGVYNGADAEFGEPINTDIHLFLDKPLNYLGLVVDYADVNKELPDFSAYAGIVVWLTSYDFAKPERLLPWLLAAMDAGVKIVLPEGIQVPDAVDDQGALVTEILRRFGLQTLEGTLGGGGEALRARYLRPEYFSSETSLLSLNLSYPVIVPLDDSVDVWQRVEREANPAEFTAGVVVGAAGGWAMTGSLLYFTADVPGTIYRVAWNISPIDFLEKALDREAQPRPDVTTFWGSRGAFSHVDVDGPYNMTQPDVPGPSRYAFDVCAEEIWLKYPYPTTLGLITAEYDPDLELRFLYEGETAAEALARPRLAWERPQAEVAAELRRILGKLAPLPWIQYGCHGYTHPLFWRELTPSYAIPGYEATLEKEIRGAVEYLNREVLPPGKSVELFHWSGECDPPEAALDILADMGMANINGGDPLYDARHDSLFYVCALSVPKGARRQIYTAGSNENIYTETWLGYKGAYNHVVTTFERSESPRRLLPVNIYYHVFPAERLAGYTAIQHAYDWAAKQDLCWMTAAEYVAAAEAFFPARIGRLDGEGGWWAEEYGACRTLRFDNEDRIVDVGASVNVAGYARHNGSLYVALLPGERAEVRFTGAAEPTMACLARASGMLRSVEAGEGSWRAEMRQWGPGFVELWAPAGGWKFVVTHQDGSRDEGVAERTADGRLRAPVADAGGGWVGVSFEKE